METSASYTHLPISSLEILLQTTILAENYKKAHHIQKAMEYILLNSTISFLPNGNMNLAPSLEEVVEYWLNGKVILKETVEGSSVESVKLTKELLAFERDVEEKRISIKINVRRVKL
tara:strand:+ start:247 stop:597 length:351 start_codon:yes stop_codon:yes gene_type:complete